MKQPTQTKLAPTRVNHLQQELELELVLMLELELELELELGLELDGVTHNGPHKH